MHQKLYLTALDALRSNYKDFANAAGFAWLVMEIVAIIDPAALENWNETFSNCTQINQVLKELTAEWAESILQDA